MPQAIFEIISADILFDRMPLIIRQKTSKASTLLMILILLPAIAAILIPFGLIAAHAAQDPAMISTIWKQPLAMTQILTGLIMWSVLFVIPMKNMLARLGREREIRIQAGRVYVTERQLFFVNKWSAALQEFRGIAHDVRATHSGSRHELILVHADKRHSLLLHTAQLMPQEIIDRACNLLKLRQLPTRELYFSFHGRSGKLPVALSPAEA